MRKCDVRDVAKISTFSQLNSRHEELLDEFKRVKVYRCVRPSLAVNVRFRRRRSCATTH
jgi:hypothetical protein